MTALQTRIAASLPQEWTVAELGEAADLKNGSAFKPEDWKTTGVPIVRIQNLKDRDAAFNYFQGDPNSKVPLKNGDLVFSWSGSIGTSFGPHYWWGDVAILNQHIFRVDLKPKTNLTKPFLYFALLHLTKEIESHAYGLAALVHVRKGDLEATCVPVPSLPEQQKISGVLGVVQRAMEQQERLLALTAELKKTLLHQLFTAGVRGEPQKQTDLGPLPESWKVMPLGSLATKISKGSSPRWQGFEYVSGGVLFVRSQNVGGGRMDFSDRVFLSPKFNEQEKRSILKNDDILINLVGASIGRVALGTPEIEGANCNQAVGFVRMDCQRSLKEFLVAFLLSPAGQQQMFFQKKDIARANLSLLDLKTFKVPVPPISESERIAGIFAQVEAKLAIHQRKYAALTALFRTLLHQLMTARIRVHDLDLEGLLAQVERGVGNSVLPKLRTPVADMERA